MDRCVHHGCAPFTTPSWRTRGSDPEPDQYAADCLAPLARTECRASRSSSTRSTFTEHRHLIFAVTSIRRPRAHEAASRPAHVDCVVNIVRQADSTSDLSDDPSQDRAGSVSRHPGERRGPVATDDVQARCAWSGLFLGSRTAARLCREHDAVKPTCKRRHAVPTRAVKPVKARERPVMISPSRSASGNARSPVGSSGQ